MISLEQVKQLESRVHSAVARIRSLTAENTTLKESLSSYERRIDELEKLVSAFKSEQQEIEAGIIAALSQLDGLEDAVAETNADLPQEQQPEELPEQDETPADPPDAPPVDEPAPVDDPTPQNTTAEDEADTEMDEEEPELDIF